MKYVMVILVVSMFSNIGFSQGINWLTWEEVSEKMHEEPRKVMIDVYTDWCGYCKKMDKSTFIDTSLVNFINKNYYAIKFDAESKDPIFLHGTEYKFVNKGKNGYHELASVILRGRLKYPSLVFMDSNLEVIQPIPGYRDASTLRMILDYYDGDFHKQMPWKTFTQSYEVKSTKPSSPTQSVPVYNVGKGN